MILIPRQLAFRYGEHFDGSTSVINCGAQPGTRHYPFAQTICALVNIVGAGGVSTNTGSFAATWLMKRSRLRS